MPQAIRDREPPRWSVRLLRWHLVAAQLAVVWAAGWLTWHPAALHGSALHPELLASVHLVTLGCLATACLGAVHAVLPVAAGCALRADWRDWAMLVAVQLTASGVSAHMALRTYAGVSWSAALLLAALALQWPRWLLVLRQGKAPAPFRIGILLAFANLGLAVVVGGLLAIQHTRPVLPNDPLQAIFAHAHLALLGFVGTLLAAVGSRLVPMYLPARPPATWLAGTAVVALGLGGALHGAAVLWPALTPMARGVTWLGGIATLGMGGSCLARRLPAPAGLQRLPAHLLQATGAALLLAALGLGTALALDLADHRLWTTYGACLLLGFASLVAGIGQRLLPSAARLHAGPFAPVDAHRVPRLDQAWPLAAWWSLGALLLPLWLAVDAHAPLPFTTAVLASAALGQAILLLRPRRQAGGAVSSRP